MSWNNKEWIVFQLLTAETTDLWSLIPNTEFIRQQGNTNCLVTASISDDRVFFSHYADILHLFQGGGFSSLFRVNVTSPVGAEKQKKKTININIASYCISINYLKQIWTPTLLSETSEIAHQGFQLLDLPRRRTLKQPDGEIRLWLSSLLHIRRHVMFLFKQRQHHNQPKTPSVSPTIRQALKMTLYNQCYEDTGPPLKPCEFSHALTLGMN